MAHDYEDVFNLDHLSDEDVHDLVRQRLDEVPDFDPDVLDIEVADGRIRIEGRVGTEGERQHIEQVLAGLGAIEYENNVVVDRLARQERPGEADRAVLDDAAASKQLGEGDRATSDTSEHLHPDDLSEMYGTRDVKKAIEEGRSYEPPEGPFQEGIEGDEQH